MSKEVDDVGTAILASCSLALIGMFVQWVADPDAPPYGFYEVAGFVAALVPWVVLGVSRLRDFWRN